MPLLNSRAPELQVEDWLNYGPESIGKGEYLLDFWSYSCPCCLDRAEKLQKIHGEYPLDVVGVHNPEFGFERKTGNLEAEVKRQGISYPVAQASSAIREAYGVNRGARQFLVRDGEIVWQNSGRDRLKDIETAIADTLGVEEKEVVQEDRGTDREVSPGTYLGFQGCRGINSRGNFRGEKEFSAPGNRKLDRVYLDGEWRQEREYLEADDGELFFYFRASEVGIVAEPNDGIRDIEVRIDGEPVPHSFAGEDLRVEGGRSYVRAKKPRFYSLIKAQYRKAELTLSPDRKTRMYALTFG